MEDSLTHNFSFVPYSPLCFSPPSLSFSLNLFFLSPFPLSLSLLRGGLYSDDGGVEQLSLAVAASHKEPSLVWRHAVPAEQDSLVRGKQDLVDLASVERARAVDGGGGREDVWRCVDLLVGRRFLFQRKRTEGVYTLLGQLV